MAANEQKPSQHPEQVRQEQTGREDPSEPTEVGRPLSQGQSKEQNSKSENEAA